METRYKNKDRTNTTRRKCFSAKTIDMLRIRFFCSYSACLYTICFRSSVVRFFLFSVQAFNLFQNSGGVVRFVFVCSCVQLTSFRISVVHVFNLFQNSCRFVCLFVVMVSTCFRIAVVFCVLSVAAQTSFCFRYARVVLFVNPTVGLHPETIIYWLFF